MGFSPSPPHASPHSWAWPIPVSMERVVVFPAPLWPSRTVICPSYMFTVRSLTASFVLLPTLKTCGDPRDELMLHSRHCALHFTRQWKPRVIKWCWCLIRLQFACQQVQYRCDHICKYPKLQPSSGEVPQVSHTALGTEGSGMLRKVLAGSGSAPSQHSAVCVLGCGYLGKVLDFDP